MFTGLIQCKGRILQISSGSKEARLTISPLKKFTELVLGESIAVNGACLTVETFDPTSFSAYASSETLQRTNLNSLRTGDEVNLERALRLGDSLGGHIVSGHVDDLCEVQSISQANSSHVIRFSCPAHLACQIIPKGSVAVDGISLTVNECGIDFFEVNVIPVTHAETTIASWKPGKKINLETDIIGKYVERMITGFAGKTNFALPKRQSQEKTNSSLTMEFFRNSGF